MSTVQIQARPASFSLRKRMLLALPVVVINGWLLCLLFASSKGFLTFLVAGLFLGTLLPIGPIAFVWMVLLVAALVGSFYCVVDVRKGAKCLLAAGCLGAPFAVIGFALFLAGMIFYGGFLLRLTQRPQSMRAVGNPHTD